MFQEGIGTTFCVAENRCLAWLLGQGQPCNFKFSRLVAEADEKETRPLAILKDVEFLMKRSPNKTHTITKIITTAHKGCDSEHESAWLELYPQDPPSIAPNIASVTCSVCVKWGALRWRAGTPWVLGNLRPRCFALGGQPLNVGSCKVRFCGCLGSDKGCSQETISIQFWLIQWQINLGIFFGSDWELNCDSWHREKVFQTIPKPPWIYAGIPDI